MRPPFRVSLVVYASKPIAHDETERRKESGADEDQKKIKALTQQNEHLQKENELLQQRLTQQNASNTDLQSKMQRMQSDIDNLKKVFFWIAALWSTYIYRTR